MRLPGRDVANHQSVIGELGARYGHVTLDLCKVVHDILVRDMDLPQFWALGGS